MTTAPRDIKFSFGKYKGQSLSDIAVLDPAYCQWCIENITKFPDIIDKLKTLVDVNVNYLSFGKYKGKTIKEINTSDPEYIRFLKTSKFIKDKHPELLADIAKLPEPQTKK